MSFDRGVLSVWDEPDLEKAEAEAEASAVIQLNIGAKCYRALGWRKLITRISIFSNVQVIRLADDYIHEHDMMVVREELRKLFPSAQLEWAQDLFVDGKHGR